MSHPNRESKVKGDGGKERGRDKCRDILLEKRERHGAGGAGRAREGGGKKREIERKRVRE